MTRLVVLERAEFGAEQHYDLRLGPLWFLWPADAVSESLGDGLDAIGAVLTAAERKPRPLKLKLPVRASSRDAAQTQIGLRMRRQTRQLLDNARWRMGGLYLSFGADPDLDGWVLVGGGDLEETDPGLSFGDFTLDLTDLYLVARPGTHKPARRLELADRRGGLVPRDTRGLIYSTDFDDHNLPAAPLVVPGDILGALGAQNRSPASITAGPSIDGRVLWRAVAADPGEVVSFLPDDATLPDRRRRYIDLDDPGSVRVWTLDGAAEYPPVVAHYSTERCLDPTLDGWERAYGDVLAPTTRFAVDNGVCRIVWLGSGTDQGLAVEFWDDTTATYRRAGRVLAGLSVREARIIEVTGERAVVEWRGGARALRAIMQRGWLGPRLEGFDDDGGGARLEIALDDAVIVVDQPRSPTWVRELVSGANPNLLANPGAETGDTTGWTPGDGCDDPGNFGVVATPVQYGSRSFKVVRDVSGGTTCIEQAVAISAGAVLSLRAEAIALTPPRSTTATLFWYDASDALIGYDTGSPATITGSWTPIVVENKTAPVGTVRVDARITLAAGAGETFYVDGLTLVHGATAIAAPDIDEDSLLLAAPATQDTTRDLTPVFASGPAACFQRARAVVVQVAPGSAGVADLASLSLCDAQPIPTVVPR